VSSCDEVKCEMRLKSKYKLKMIDQGVCRVRQLLFISFASLLPTPLRFSPPLNIFSRFRHSDLVCHETRLTGLEEMRVEASPIFDTFVSRYPPEVEKVDDWSDSGAEIGYLRWLPRADLG
jgi:hypothetical protein